MANKPLSFGGISNSLFKLTASCSQSTIFLAVLAVQVVDLLFQNIVGWEHEAINNLNSEIEIPPHDTSLLAMSFVENYNDREFGPQIPVW